MSQFFASLLVRNSSFCFLACAVCLGPVVEAQDNADEEKRITKLVDTVLDELIEKRYEDLAKRFTPRMLEALPVEKLKPTLGQVDLIAGAYKSKGKTRTLSRDPLTIEATVLHQRSALVYRLSFDEQNKLAGFFVRPAALPSTEKQADQTSSVYEESEVSLDRDGITFEGTLCLPKKNDAPWPVLIFHSGSGPTDRNCNGPLIQTNATQKLARKLAENGIASLRYDKRGSGTTPVGVAESELTPAVLVDDYLAWSTRLATDIRFSSQFLAGHSEGAQLAFRTARENTNVSAVISIAGSGRSIDQLLRSQLKGKISDELYEKADQILEELAQGRLVADVPQELASVIRPSIQRYLMGFIKRTPVEDVAALDIPVLIVQGDKDIQVAVEDAELLDQAGTMSTKKIIAGMNHVLVEISSASEQLASYRQPELEISRPLVTAIVDFVKTVDSQSAPRGLSDHMDRP
ncbi:MAG: alpha/beta fold hydrolase [Planctomycetota bacterium]